MTATGDLTLVFHAVVLAITVVAACTDVWKGEIPNWLTLPVIVAAPIVHGVMSGGAGLLDSLIGLLVCSIVPLIIFYRQGMAGGDVKLFAAIGAAGGIYVGLEVQLLSLVAASIYAIGQLAWNGKLLRSLTSSLFLGLNPILPRRFRRTIPTELMHRIRLGAAILLGAIIVLANKHPSVWGPLS
jgi:prepilin peptidase CpaA